jgi:type IV pilus assembly protein PilB
MFTHRNEAIAEVLRGESLVAKSEIELLIEESRGSGQVLSDLVIERGMVSRVELLDAVAKSLGCSRATQLPESLPATTVGLLDASQARNYGAIPVRAEGRSVELLVVDPFNSRIVDDLSFALDREVRLVVAEPNEVEALIKRYYGEPDSFAQLVTACAKSEVVNPSGGDLSKDDIEALAGQTPVIAFVNLIFGQAVKDKASDVHFEPFEHEFKIRYRVDGALYEMTPPPKALALPITSRIKVLANLNIAERRVPQDGRIKLMIGGRSVDVRVSTLPTQFGESVVLRILDQSAVRLDLAQLGMREDVLAGVNEIIRRPNGIFVVTGPTGSGKTTTLYSALRAINTTEVKVITAEDPIEYEIEGITQVPVNPLIGFSFAAALRSFLRQDPDVIMVGEIRDLETAQIAIQASLTGHLVLTTLHTNDAAGAVARLSDIGIPPFLIAGSVEAVLAQRLLRKVCPRCSVPDDTSPSLLRQAGIEPDALEGARVLRGVGCQHCSNTGYRGRVGIFEWLKMTDSLREDVLNRAPALELKHAAVREGMRTLRQEALRALAAGITSIEEVIKYT